MDLVTARRTAERLLAADHPDLWAHAQGAARRAELLRPVLDDQTDVVAAAAVLHGIGWCPRLAGTGFPPIDAARYLRDRGVDELTVRLVAHQSHAVYQARARGLDRRLLAEFAPPPAILAAALTWCDMTSAPDGTPTTLNERLARMHEQHRDDPVWVRAQTARLPALHASMSYIDASLAAERRSAGRCLSGAGA